MKKKKTNLYLQYLSISFVVKKKKGVRQNNASQLCLKLFAWLIIILKCDTLYASNGTAGILLHN